MNQLTITLMNLPKGYHTINMYLTVKGAAEAMEFYKKAFGAVERYRLPMPDGKIGHGELSIGDSVIMLADADPAWGNKTPEMLGGTPVTIALYVDDVDAVFAQALAAGATVKDGMTVSDKFYGDRSGSVTDPFGHCWTIATQKENLTPEEMKTRMDKWMVEQQAKK